MTNSLWEYLRLVTPQPISAANAAYSDPSVQRDGEAERITLGLAEKKLELDPLRAGVFAKLQAW